MFYNRIALQNNDDYNKCDDNSDSRSDNSSEINNIAVARS